MYDGEEIPMLVKKGGGYNTLTLKSGQQYRAGTTKVENESLEDIQRRGTKVIDEIFDYLES